MEHPISIDIETQFPDAIRKDGAPANCRYRIPYTKNEYWQNNIFRIAIQDHDAKDAYLSHIEITAKERFSFIIRITGSDLFWLYLLNGNIKIVPHPKGTEHNGFLDHLNEDEYGLFYSPPREFQITVEPGLHILFLFVVNSTWLQRHPIVEPTHYQKLINYLQHKKDRYNSTKVLPICDESRKEILHLLTMPDFGEMLMDSKVYVPIAKLILISREDLKNNGTPVSRNMQNTLMLIRGYYKKQISIGLAPSITEVAEHFKIGIRQLRNEHKAFYGHSLQFYITEKRMSTAAELLLDTDKPISVIAYDLGYNIQWFSTQFKNHFNLSPQDFRVKHKGSSFGDF